MKNVPLWHLLAATLITLTACNESNEITIEIDDEFGPHYRPATEQSSDHFDRVYSYIPAPGQFINEQKTGGFNTPIISHAEATAYAEDRLRAGNWVSLGAFGGYLVVGFDHSIRNSGGYDFTIMANSFAGSSEPGIVWVMQDENGNGEPDDVWYELKGSESDKATCLRNYSVTYFRPSAPQQAVEWIDSFGNTGQVLYMAQFHNQDYYYPAWIEADSYTLTGTKLTTNTDDPTQSDNGLWQNKAYEWGYADNFSPVDRLSNNANMGGGNNSPNHFKISNAIKADGSAAELKFIDFVKIQSAMLTQSGPLGEVSTEVCGISDDHCF
ncbi:MAG: hypothetical protein E7149_06185 [Rikenellaceae bacterium]|nr:hypothetical protein [Rikenellaceae bacterium]